MKFTQKDYDLFRRVAGATIKKLGLTNWSVGYQFKKLDADTYAECSWNYQGKVATMRLNSAELDTIDGHSVERSAKHEVCELLLADLGAMCNFGFAKDRVEEAIHDVIRRLEVVL
jgi:hypothetical protein